MTEEPHLSHFRGLLWDDPQESLLSHFFVTLNVLGLGGFCGARRVTTLFQTDHRNFNITSKTQILKYFNLWF